MQNLKNHWEKIYKTKDFNEVSWYQSKPEASLNFIAEFNLSKNAKIIDIGGGDSNLIDFLLDDGFKNVTVLDISEEALERAKTRLGHKAANVNWIVADASNFQTTEKYDVWHDRAAFHFLTEKDQIVNYLKTLEKAVIPGGFVVMATFSENGPKKCSGIEIKQYSTTDLQELLANNFVKLNCKNVDHLTPWGTIQNFTFCSFKKID